MFTRTILNAMPATMWVLAVVIVFIESTKGNIYLPTPYAIAFSVVAVGHVAILVSNAVYFINQPESKS